MLNTLAENTGVHLHSIIEGNACKIHHVPEGVPCYHLPNNVNKEAYYAGACGSRVKLAGYNGKISPESMRKKAPVKRKGDVPTRPFTKKPNAQSARKTSK